MEQETCLTAISAATEEQTVSTQEIARNVRDAAIGTEQVATNISSVSVSTDETRTASHQVLEVPRTLSPQTEAMNGRIRSFLAEIKTA